MRGHTYDDERNQANDTTGDVARMDAWDAKRHRCCEPGCLADADPHYDGHGIYLFRACDRHYAEKIKEYRPDIHEAYECDEPIEAEDY
jgi:hypothetical protein